MKNVRKIFHLLSYLQYPLVAIALARLIFPLFRGFEYLSTHSEYLFSNYNQMLIYYGLALSFSSLQDPTKTSLRYERKIWKTPRKAKVILFATTVTMMLFFFTGFVGLMADQPVMKEFTNGSFILSIGLLSYLKFQLDLYAIHTSAPQP
ncbi:MULTISPECIES: hypothetical protein [Bacteroidales]|uniref:hypothetical protein n=1 Tax=Bacteroidales TaxID=171549 RepID=UPI00359F7593